MTNEQRIQHARRLAELLPDLHVEQEADAVRAALLLLTDEAENDRALGAAVRAKIASFGPGWLSPDVLESHADGIDETPPLGSEVLIAIASALRAELSHDRSR